VPKAPATHVLMDGGILSVPHDDTRLFHDAYISDVLTHRKLYVVEQKTDIFKFFVDIDYKGETALTSDEILDICHVIDGCVNSGRCCIARTSPRRLESGEIKTGIHIHWPDLNVSRSEAHALRTKMLMHLDGDIRDWSKIIDASVYGGSGLRMIWSHKKPTGEPYVPWMMLDGQVFGSEPSQTLLELFSIRTTGVSTARVVADDHCLLETFIREHVDGQHLSRVKQVVRHEKDGWFVQTDSRYCERIKGLHRSNHVWFNISKNGCLTQRCFDEDCSGFVGRKHNLPPTLEKQFVNNAALIAPCSHNCILDFFPKGFWDDRSPGQP
jgi:hypothetical protein